MCTERFTRRLSLGARALLVMAFSLTVVLTAQASSGTASSPQICPSGACAVPISVLPNPTAACQSTSLTLTCANPATYNVTLAAGQTYTFTLCGATCPGSNANFDSRIEVYQGLTLIATNSNACGLNGETVFAAPSAGTYCVSVVPEAGFGDFTLSYYVTCQPPASLLIGPSFFGTTDPTCSQDVTFSVSTAGTGDFTYDWTITPVTGGSAVPPTRSITRPENIDQFTSRITGVGMFNVSVNITNSCGSASQQIPFDFRDAAGPDIVCTAARVPCMAPPPEPTELAPADRGGRAGSEGRLHRGSVATLATAPPAADGARAGGPGVAQALHSSTPTAQPGIDRRFAENRDAINRVLFSSASDEEASRFIAEKLALAPGSVIVHDGSDPNFFRPPGTQALSCPTPCTTGTLTASHPYYDVFLACGNGAYTARTGMSHSVTVSSGAQQNVIYSGAAGFPGTSDITLHVHNNNMNFLRPAGGQACAFNPPDTTAEPNNIGLEQEWTLDPLFPGISPLVFREEIVAFGSTEPNSGIRMTLGVQNPVTSTVTANVGFRWQTDYMNAGDDGPGFATVKCSPFTIGQERFTEHELLPVEIEDFYRIQNNTTTPVFANFTSSGPIQGFPGTGTPDRLIYGRWPTLTGSVWDYVTNEGANADSDSATLIYFGYSPSAPIAVAPGQTVTRSVVIFTQGQQQSCGAFNPGTGVATSIDVCQDECVLLGATGTDNCSTPTVTLQSSSAGAPACLSNPCRVQFTTPGTYTYTWEARDTPGNVTTCDTAVTVFAPPLATLAAAGPVCAGSAVTLDASGSAPNGCTVPLEYQWSDQTGVVVPWGPASTYGPIVPGGTSTYMVEVRCPSTTITCLTSATRTVIVVAYPVPTIAPVAAICVGSSTVLDASGTNAGGCPVALEYQWSDPSGVVRPWSTIPTYTAAPGSTTVYTVEARCPVLTTCIGTANRTVNVVPVPTAVAGPDVNVCQNTPVTLDGSGSAAPNCAGGALYEWRQGATVVRPWSTVPTWLPPVGTIGTTVYTLWVSCASTPTCQASDSVTVTLRNCTMVVLFDRYGAQWTTRGHSVEVTWSTIEERDTNVFVVERAPAASGPWIAVGSPVSAQGPGYPYRLVDGTATPGTQPWYRIVEYTSNGRGSETPAFQSAR